MLYNKMLSFVSIVLGLYSMSLMANDVKVSNITFQGSGCDDLSLDNVVIDQNDLTSNLGFVFRTNKVEVPNIIGENDNHLIGRDNDDPSVDYKLCMVDLVINSVPGTYFQSAQVYAEYSGEVRLYFDSEGTTTLNILSPSEARTMSSHARHNGSAEWNSQSDNNVPHFILYKNESIYFSNLSREANIRFVLTSKVEGTSDSSIGLIEFYRAGIESNITFKLIKEN